MGKLATTYHIEGKLDGATFYWSGDAQRWHGNGWVDDPAEALHFNYAQALAEAAKIKPWCDDRGVVQRPQIKADA